MSALLPRRQALALAAAVGCTVALSPLSANAQDAIPSSTWENGSRTPEPSTTSGSGVSELSTVTVLGEAVRGATTEGSDSFTTNRTTIGLSEKDIKEIPQSVSVLTRERLDDQNLTSLREAMEHTTGVTVQPYGLGSQYQLRSRGYNIDSLMLDGSRVRAPFGVLSNGGLYDTALYDRLEVMRGPTGILQGSGEPSGTINLVRKHAQRDFGLHLSQSAGSWDHYRSMLDVTGPLNESGSLRGRVVGVYEDQDSFVDEAYSRDYIGYGTLEYDVTPDTTLSVGVARQVGHSRPSLGLPAGSNGALFDLDRSTYLGSSWDRADEDATRYFAELAHNFDNGARFTLKTNYIDLYHKNKTSSGTQMVIDENTGDLATRNIKWSSEIKSKSLETDFTTPFSLLGVEHSATIGASYYKTETQTPYAYGTGNYLGQYSLQNLYDPEDLPEPDAFDLYPGWVSSDLRQKSIYGQTNLNITPRFTLVAGGRADWYESNSGTYEEGFGGTSDHGSGREFVPYAGVIYRLTPSINLYTSYTEIFKPQTEQSVGGDLIEPRTGKQVEAGIKGGSPDGTLNWHFAVFKIKDQNRAYADAENIGYYVAIGETRSKGFEAEISGSPLPRWDISAGYTYTDVNYKDELDTSFSPVIYDPRHAFNLWTRYRFSDDPNHGWQVGGGVDVISRTYADDGDAEWIQGGYTLLSAKLGYRFNRHFDVSLKGNNLTDKKYYATVRGTSRNNYYGEPRNYTLTMNYRY